MAQKFWMVFNPKAGPTKAEHESREQALSEAGRLAHKHPNQEIYVLEVVEVYKATVVLDICDLYDPTADQERAKAEPKYIGPERRKTERLLIEDDTAEGDF